MTSDPQEHWQTVYKTKAPTEVAWYQPIPQRSLALIQRTGLPPDAAILDVGGGASTLVDHLLAAGFSDITVLDVAPAALAAAQARLGAAGAPVQMIAADVIAWQSSRRYELWHDRAVFHFLVDAALREQYLNVLRAALAPDGCVVMATFGPEGPTRCSGLEVRRYTAAELSAVLGPTFRLVTSGLEEHMTPGGNVQQFTYGLWQAE
jgi:trans-aconitate methyltransferase